LANKLRVAIVGFGHFGHGVADRLHGDVSELLIVARRGDHIEDLTKEEDYIPSVIILEGDIDGTSIDSALRKLDILPSNENGDNAKNENSADSIDVVIVDLGDEWNDKVVAKVRSHSKKTIIIPAIRDPANIEELEKLGASWVVCPPMEAAERTVLRLHGLKVHDIVKVSVNLHEATIDVPDDFTGLSMRQIKDEFGVRVIFIIQSVPERKGRGKKVLGYKDKEFIPEDLDYHISGEDTSMRVLGTFSQLKRLGDKIR